MSSELFWKERDIVLFVGSVRKDAGLASAGIRYTVLLKETFLPPGKMDKPQIRTMFQCNDSVKSRSALFT